MYIPSYDFNLFKIPNFSPLGAQEFNAMTEFSANTPLSYVDYSLNQLAALTQPNNPNPYSQRQFPSEIIPYELQSFFQGQSRADIEAEVAKRQAEFEKAKADVKAPKTCPEGYKPVSVFGIFSYCGKQMVSDGQGTMGDKEAPAGLGTLEKTMNALPSGSGIFLIAVVVIILLFLFVKR